MKEHQERLKKGMATLKFQFEPVAFFQELHRMGLQVIQDQQLNGHGRLRIHAFRSGTGTYLPSENTPAALIEVTAI